VSTHRLNLAFRFILELAALFAMGYWGWTQHQNWTRFLWAIGMPLFFAILWGTFAVPDDPSRSGSAPVAIPGLVRLLLELAIFAIGVWCCFAAGQPTWGWVFGVAVLLHYILSYDRVVWLIKQ
jgi:hypothetical protein